MSTTGALNIVQEGTINSDTAGQGDAGIITIQAANILIDGQESELGTGISTNTVDLSGELPILEPATGDAGRIDIRVDDALVILNGGWIQSRSNSQGNSGRIVIHAHAVDMDASDILTSIEKGNGNAGKIQLVVNDSLTMANNAQINSSTFSNGAAGNIDIVAGTIIIHGDPENNLSSGIYSSARGDSSGQVGILSITTDALLSQGGTISISSSTDSETAGVTDNTPGELTIHAETIHLDSDSLITASSNNAIPASNINIIATENLYIDHSQITTSATQSHGGNIELAPEILILDGGFIQANAQGDGNNGGNVTINTETLIASQGNLQTGGALVDFDADSEQNVIQATADKGESGKLDFPPPQLNISGSMLQLDNELIDLATLIESPCSNPNIRNSKLTRLGRGGLPENTTEARSVPLSPQRLAQITTTPQRTADSLTQPTADIQPLQLTWRYCR